MPQEKLSLVQFERRLSRLAILPGQSAMIGTRDPEAGVILRVLEFGSITGQAPWPHPGPHTILALDPDTGAQVVVSARAPQGFIRIQAHEFAELLRRGLRGSANWLRAEEVDELLQTTVKRAADAALERLKSSLPSGSNRLPASLTVLDD